ncbi:hypothetical protein Aoki45_36680 [Algoriphagus sp. oki45]|uniref:hypothetical protein n=1 Tax=Algoriphagus sp. oki45 TaxID=3067294 RepID=UPI0027ED6C65|nr:hypothetical protein Aoki45_36680 [Algoriphagus sp. oki45]
MKFCIFSNYGAEAREDLGLSSRIPLTFGTKLNKPYFENNTDINGHFIGNG